jgi:hypothetical protein
LLTSLKEKLIKIGTKVGEPTDAPSTGGMRPDFGRKSANVHASSGVIRGTPGPMGLLMRTKEQFLREWTRSLSDVTSTKTWKGDVPGKDFSGAPSFFIFVDMDYFSLLAPVIWTPAAYREKSIMVPRGFVTDFASVPRLFWSLLPPIGRYGYAALFHDYVYWQQTILRAEADRVFKDTMVELGVSAWKRGLLFGAVRLFGFVAWRGNARLKAAGERRILRKFPSDITTSWMEWKQLPDVFE